jgi:protocatechuate 3,4-dioxygenase beta subunit
LTAPIRMPASVVRPELTEGSYFVDGKLNRSDIRSDPMLGSIREGLPLTLEFLVSKLSSECCVPLAGAKVDVCYCDAAGVYPDVSDPGLNARGQKFLRGHQVTDSDGVAIFTTIYPGWYRGRTAHILFKRRETTDSASGYDSTSLFFFDGNLSDRVFAHKPNAAKSERTVRSNDDQIYAQGGDMMILNLGVRGVGLKSALELGLQI